MFASSPEIITLALLLQERLAGMGLTPSLAKLYSQHTRLVTGQEGLIAWRSDEAQERLDEALQLIDAALIQCEDKSDSWREGMKRAGEILEWLVHPEFFSEYIPLDLLAAATYQIAGYPARASGLLNQSSSQDISSKILRALLQANYPQLMRLIVCYWGEYEQNAMPSGNSSSSAESSENFHKLIVQETISALGILCSAMRWGDEIRIEKAIDKLNSVAKVLLHGRNLYSWLLARLCAMVARTYLSTSMRYSLGALLEGIGIDGRVAFERYLRSSYQSCKALAWPSQMRGIERLVQNGSFALCTPTGSGKTTVAEIAILQSLFVDTPPNGSAPLVIYLVPSKALATEVEAKLASVVKKTVSSSQNVVVTGLYGGTDWGPTDVWLTAEERTVLICTYEKAEALMKFLGCFFLQRVRLIVVDEAHNVQYKTENIYQLSHAEERSLRLEVLVTRLRAYLNHTSCRFIALSAVAADSELALSKWITGDSEANPVKTTYRSTRQLIGRLECLRGRGFQIQYDLLDGKSLAFKNGGQTDKPYIPSPFPTCPGSQTFDKEKSLGKKLRPYLFWAAMHLASVDDKGQRKAVLVSITDHPEWYASDLLKLLNNDWAEIDKPEFFKAPDPNTSQAEIWNSCLDACADYFTEESREYQLLRKGIIVHHGKMPGLLARLLIRVIDKKIVSFVIATSTLSEGVNLPFETVLIPDLERRGRNSEPLSLREFSNLIGRAGRPGFGTEGRSLVIFPDSQLSLSLKANEEDIKTFKSRIKKTRESYNRIIKELEQSSNNDAFDATSPLAELIRHIENKWQKIALSTRHSNFLDWLEQTAPLSYDENPLSQEDEEETDDQQLISALDTLDSILLASIVELEQLNNLDLNLADLEEKLQEIWRQSYAYYASKEQERLEKIFVTRGKAIQTTIYPDSTERRRLYKTSLPPRAGNSLINLYPQLREHLITGNDYPAWNEEQKFEYIVSLVNQLSTVKKFRLKPPGRGQPDSNTILRWWLCHYRSQTQPRATQVSTWHGYVSKNFQYRFCWALGSIIALAVEQSSNGRTVIEVSSESWPETGLPWIVLWIKDLITWGTLDPVSAFLLARVERVTNRRMAEELARAYYVQFQALELKEKLNAKNIRDWVSASFSDPTQSLPDTKPSRQVSVSLLRDFKRVSKKTWRVIPVDFGSGIRWFDSAGYPLALSEKPENWQIDFLDEYDFILDAQNSIVSSSRYL